MIEFIWKLTNKKYFDAGGKVMRAGVINYFVMGPLQSCFFV